MDYTIAPSEDGTHIILKMKGQINRQGVQQPNLEAHALGKRLKIGRYLVDATEAVNTDTVVDSHQFAYRDMLTMPGIDRRARVAILVSPGDHSHDFIETVCRNAGLDVKIFTDSKPAKRFLSGEQKNESR